jgi:cytochrome bd-type quinol oxidase subunit 1
VIEQILTIVVVSLIYVVTWFAFTIYRKRDKNLTISKYLRVLGYALGIQAFIVLPWFLGEIARGENSFNIIAECIKETRRFGGWGNTIFTFYLFLIFYSALFLVPMLIANFLVERKEADDKDSLVLFLPIWFVLNLVIFYVPLVSVLSDTWSGFITFLFWCWISFAVINSFRKLKNKRGDLSSRSSDEDIHDA